ncbi:MAG: NAD(P)/FAD-dependent oxidoreductase [bacterium]|nr:NAD(P)/FAD-dependent oxidoreductase [bacterium]
MPKKGGKKHQYDVVVLGSGSAGMSAAMTAREEGVSVCLIEREKLGGECPNWACVPSKALLASAKAYRHANNVAAFGIKTGKVSHQFSDVMKYREQIVDHITGGGEFGDRYLKMAKDAGIDVLHGTGSFSDTHTIQVKSGMSTVNVIGKTFVLALGTEIFVPPIEGVNETPFWGFKDVMMATKQPKSLIVLGGGPVGCELATVFASFGTKVTLVQGAMTVLNREDHDVSILAKQALEKIGIDVRVGAVAKSVKFSRGSFSLSIKNEQRSIVAEKLLVATGKRPATDELGLDVVSLKTTDRGWIQVNENQKTSRAHIFAAGDITGGYQFTHTAHPAGDIAGYNAAQVVKRKKALRSIDLSVVPRVTFIDPEVASVGLTEEQAVETKKKILIGKFPIAGLGRSVTDGTRVGIVKIVVDAKTRKILGGHIIGERAGEMIHEISLALYLGAKVDALSDMIHAYPTYSEAVAAAAASVQ